MQVGKLEGKLSQVQTEKEEVGRQCAAEQKRAAAAETQGQQRLIGALRRLDYLVGCLSVQSHFKFTVGRCKSAHWSQTRTCALS